MFFFVVQANSLPWMTTSVSLAVLGIYYGFLSTLPIGPAQLLCVRTFLLEAKGTERQLSAIVSANKVAVAAISGLVVAQVMLLLSVYFPSLYALWVKPHTLSLLVLPYLMLRWNRIKQFESNIVEKEIWGDFGIPIAFLESLFLQLMNPILLPSPVFARLMGLFLFRYSNVPAFIIGGILGSLFGHIAFVCSIWFLLLRLERDSPTIYPLLKRVVHRAFPPILLSFCLAYLGRAPIGFLSNRFSYNISSQSEKPWPDIVFDHSINNRPSRIVNHNDLNAKRPFFNKKHFSEYFFDTCVSNGKRRLSHNFPQSLSIFHKEIELCLKVPQLPIQGEEQIYENWTEERQNRLEQFRKTIETTMVALDEGVPLQDVIEKRVVSFSDGGEIVRKGYDPRLGYSISGRRSLLKNNSPLLSTEADLSESKTELLKPQERSGLASVSKNNQLKSWLSQQWEEMNDLPILPWQPLEFPENQNLLDFSKQDSIDIEISQKDSMLTESPKDSISWDVFLQNDSLASKRIEMLKSKSVEPWKTIFKNQQWPIHKWLNTNNKAYTVLPFHKEAKNKSQRSMELLEMYKPMPFWNFTSVKPDKERRRLSPVQRRRFAPVLRFFMTGSMRNRARKNLLWKVFQERLRSPMFLRVLDSVGEPNDSLQLDQSLWLSKEYNQNILDATKAARAIRNRWNFSLIHVPRGYLLVIQAYFRKYVKLPLLIISKNSIRSLFFQPSEWQQDWQEWSQERYIDCAYDGKERSLNVRPTFDTAGKQIKIANPFHLRPWHPSSDKQVNILQEANSSSDNAMNLHMESPVYLTIWGQETDVPFGRIKKKPSFWKPIFKGLNLLLRREISAKLFRPFQQWIRPYIQEINETLSRLEQQVVSFFESSSTNLEKTQKQNNQLSSKPQDTQYNNKLKVANADIQADLSTSNVDRDTKELSRLDSPSLEPKIQIEAQTDLIETFEYSLKPENKTTSIEYDLHKTRHTQESVHKKRARIQVKSFRGRLVKEQQKLFHSIRRLVQLRRKLVSHLNKKVAQLNRRFFQTARSSQRLIIRFIIQVQRLIANFIQSLTRISHSLVLEVKILKNQYANNSSRSQDQPLIPSHEGQYPTQNLSQAYLIHKIWQARFMNRPDLTCLMNAWIERQPLKKSIQDYLNKQGILGTKEPQELMHSHWFEWLRGFRSYTPSSRLWNDIVPERWAQEISQHWKQISNPVLELQPEDVTFHSDESKYSKNMSYHQPLFQKAVNLAKRWRLHLLVRGYTDFFNDADVDRFPLWKTNILETAAKDRLNKIRLEGGMQATEQERLGLEEDPLVHFGGTMQHTNMFSWLPSLEETASTIQPVVKPTNKQLPIKQREQQRKNLKLELSQRFLTSTVAEDYWSSRLLRDISRKLIKEVELQRILGNRGLAINRVSELSKNMPKYLKIVCEGDKDILLNSEWYYQYKVLDDELLMYNTASSLLRFANRRQNSLALSTSEFRSTSPVLIQDSAYPISLIPEDIFLPRDLREFTILEYLDLTAGLYDYEWLENQVSKKDHQEAVDNRQQIYEDKHKILRKQDIGKSIGLLKENHQELDDRQTINRFLWPIHRVEDLACMNRFWIGTANQSRFSMLRIRTSPTVLS
jgi:hypothetical protein